MRCYICDWSPVGERSLFNETLELNHLTDFRAEVGLPPLANQYHSGKAKLLFDKQQRPICSHCALHGQGEDAEPGETILSEEEVEKALAELEDVE